MIPRLIASAAVSRLAWNVSVPKDAVKLKVEKGWITLTGEVDWHFQQEAGLTTSADFMAWSASLI
jgi:osmotically-inducible protein OsmY